MLNPQDWEIRIMHDSISDGFVEVTIKTNMHDACFRVDTLEAKVIGEWFLALSKELKPKAKVKK